MFLNSNKRLTAIPITQKSQEQKIFQMHTTFFYAIFLILWTTPSNSVLVAHIEIKFQSIFVLRRTKKEGQIV
jgi:hypothetical protein